MVLLLLLISVNYTYKFIQIVQRDFIEVTKNHQKYKKYRPMLKIVSNFLAPPIHLCKK